MARGEVDHPIDVRFTLAFTLLAVVSLGGAAAAASLLVALVPLAGWPLLLLVVPVLVLGGVVRSLPGRDR